MAVKKLAFLKKIGKFILLLATFIAAIMLLFSVLAKILPPSFSSIIAYCGLLFPYIFIINIVTLVIWLILDYRWALLPIIVILLNVNNFDRHFQLRAQDPLPPVLLPNVLLHGNLSSYKLKAGHLSPKDRPPLRRKMFVYCYATSFII